MVVLVAINAAYAVGDLAHPESAPAFVATVMVVGGALVTIVLSVLAALRRPASGGRVWAVTGVAFVALVGVSVVAASRVDDAEVQPGDERVTAADFEYPEEISLNTHTGLVIDNEDALRHTFVVDGPDAVSLEVPASSSARTVMNLPPGSYRFYCDIAGHEDMKGILEVS